MREIIGGYEWYDHDPKMGLGDGLGQTVPSHVPLSHLRVESSEVVTVDVDDIHFTDSQDKQDSSTEFIL